MIRTDQVAIDEAGAAVDVGRRLSVSDAAYIAPELVRTDQVAIDEAGAAVDVGRRSSVSDAAYIAPAEARVLAEALVELADYAGGVR